MRKRAYELVINIEIRWQQRARCNWLASGDRNTHFFHSYASARNRKNTVTILEVEGVELKDGQHIKKAFKLHLQQVLGTESDLMTLDPKPQYRLNTVDLSSLQDEFTTHEVHTAVRQLPNSKAVGPDGVPMNL